MSFSKDLDLIQLSTKNAEKFIKEWPPFENKAEQSMAVNCNAHGFFMGYKDAESEYTKVFFKRKEQIIEDDMEIKSLDAAEYYMSKKRLNLMGESFKELIIDSVRDGFIDGFHYYEIQRGTRVAPGSDLDQNTPQAIA